MRLGARANPGPDVISALIQALCGAALSATSRAAGGALLMLYTHRAATSGFGTTRTFRNVRYPVAVGCKADFEQAAFRF